jgi:CDP-glucose 4,6-dehydratase
MESLKGIGSFFRKKKVLITGNTGFKGSWLSLWLEYLGAEVYGYALAPYSNHDHYSLLNFDRCTHIHSDIRDYNALSGAFSQFQPEIVFHLAAQPLVSKSYEDPRYTFETNVMGAVNLLQCAKESKSIKSLVVVTSDKCYKNMEWEWGYRETDVLGGHDPYSSSKASVEIIFASYLSSFFNASGSIGAATARAGNVIGGGDWSSNRIVPDSIRALKLNRPIELRNPNSTRPWQHVLEPLSGYLLLAKALYEDPVKYSGAWNFGPKIESSCTVGDLVSLIIEFWGGGEMRMDAKMGDSLHEAGKLHLNCDKAHEILRWGPRWDVRKSAFEAVSWYKKMLNGDCVRSLSLDQIKNYTEDIE